MIIEDSENNILSTVNAEEFYGKTSDYLDAIRTLLNSNILDFYTITTISQCLSLIFRWAFATMRTTP